MENLNFHSRQAEIFEQLARQYQNLDGELYNYFYCLYQYHQQQIDYLESQSL
ncbi:hypothetical protein GLW08_14050 [Pontibacillus yanchengensis]|uniref:Uncharacterized protein n=2 Tax=Pontibacillus yanchengensis TaxID=462910 RepID=A0ACC7VI37_9BACI|nr:hypothetical protein [Pontibacillus yanchengensis]MYL34587.1 hypothetical protein [Pontibacillus yanchengensis]MYL54453.1 hypothetical protein [Pontibacillus yanchengensis]